MRWGQSVIMNKALEWLLSSGKHLNLIVWLDWLAMASSKLQIAIVFFFLRFFLNFSPWILIILVEMIVLQSNLYSNIKIFLFKTVL